MVRVTGHLYSPNPATVQVSASDFYLYQSVALPGDLVGVKASLTATGDISGVVAEAQVFDSNKNKVAALSRSGIQLYSRQPVPITQDIPLPSTLAPGHYSVTYSIWSADLAKLYPLSQPSASFTVLPPLSLSSRAPASATLSISASSASAASITVGGVENLSASVVSNANLSNLNVEVMVLSESGQNVGNQLYTGVTLVASSPSSFAYEFRPPSTLPVGLYHFAVGVWSADWSTHYLYATTSSSFLYSGSTPSAAAIGGANPLGGVTFYNSSWNEAKNHLDACPQMVKIANNPESIWMAGGESIADDSSVIAEMVSGAQATNTVPIFILYNIPARDCGSYSAGGMTPDQYPSWVANIARGIGNQKSVVILEPDALADIPGPGGSCSGLDSMGGAATRLELIKGAVATLRSLAPGAIVYIDAGNPAWVPVDQMAASLKAAGIDQAQGFSLNVSNFITTTDNINYGKALSNLVGGKHFIIDTSRNGNGPGDTWCNPAGRALGEPPQGFSSGVVDAYFWGKGPGGSDGSCNGYTGFGFYTSMACEQAANAHW